MDLGLAFISTVFNLLHALPYIVRIIVLHPITLICDFARDFIPDDARRYALQIHFLQHRALVVLGLASFSRRWIGAVHASIAISRRGDEPSGAWGHGRDGPCDAFFFFLQINDCKNPPRVGDLQRTSTHLCSHI